jgi:hypothetical protein
MSKPRRKSLKIFHSRAGRVGDSKAEEGLPARKAWESGGPAEEDQWLTVVLAEKLMGWMAAPGRFLTGQRGWIPTWRFQPEKNLNDVFRLLDRAEHDAYEMGSKKGDRFWVRVEIAGRVGEAHHASKPRAITHAIARAIGIDPEAKG